jgi:hypothetical protein
VGLAPGSVPWKARIDDAIGRRDADLEAIRAQMETVDRSGVVELERRLQIRKLDFEIEVLGLQVETFNESVRAPEPRAGSGEKGQANSGIADDSVGGRAGEDSEYEDLSTASTGSGADADSFPTARTGDANAVLVAALQNAREFRDRLIAVKQARPDPTPPTTSLDTAARPAGAGEVTR